VLADEHRGVCLPSLLGIQGRFLQRERREDSRSRERLSRRAISGSAELDRAGVPQAHLLPPSGKGRSLRGVGTADDFLRGTPKRVQIATLSGTDAVHAPLDTFQIGKQSKDDTMTQTIAIPQDSEQAADKFGIRPFRVTIPEKDLVELRRRIAATR